MRDQGLIERVRVHYKSLYRHSFYRQVVMSLEGQVKELRRCGALDYEVYSISVSIKSKKHEHVHLSIEANVLLLPKNPDAGSWLENVELEIISAEFCCRSLSFVECRLDVLDDYLHLSNRA